MLLKLFTTLSSGLLLAVLMWLIYKIISYRLATIKFKKQLRDIPLLSEHKNPLANFFNVCTVLLGPESCKLIKSYHDRYGKTGGMMVGDLQCASTVDLDLIKTIILEEAEDHLDRAKIPLPLDEFNRSIMLAPKDEWRQVRKVVAPALANNKFKTPNVIDEIDASIQKVIDYIEKKLETEKPDYRFNWDDLAHKYSLDLVYRCFYKQYNLIDFDNPHDEWIESIEESINNVQTSWVVKFSFAVPQILGIVDWLIWNFTKQGQGRKKIFSFVRSQAKLGLEAKKQLKELGREAQKTGTKIDPNNFIMKDGTRFRRNMIDYVIDQYHDRKITKDQYLNNATFMLAAADKTATDCLVFTIYQLSINQHIQDKLRSSIIASGPDSEYLDWVLKESLRVLPPAPIGCTRTITRDIQLKDGVIPANTTLLTCAYAIHRLEEYWGKDAEEFKPERWSDTSNHHPMQYIPFGAGLRSCPGKQFALFEMKRLLVALLTRYKFEGEPRDDAMTFNTPMFIFVIPNSPTKVVIRRLNDCDSRQD